MQNLMKTSGSNPKFAVITGATCGIGKVFAREFAELGYHLLITGRREELLRKFAKELYLKFKVEVKPMKLELSKTSDLTRLLTAIDQLDRIEILVNNAGFGTKSQFFSEAFSKQEKMLKVHINATCHITHRVVPKMMANGGGTIINVSSLAAFTPLSNNYFYSASKAFLATFSESLHLGLRDKNIRVQALCPGFTRTEFHLKMNLQEPPSKSYNSFQWMSAESVVKKSLKALQHKQRVIYIPGVLNNLVYRTLKIVPRWLYYLVAERLAA